MSHLLHPEYFEQIPLNGRYIANAIDKRASQIAANDSLDGDITVAIRTLNEADDLRRLLTDVRSQQFIGEVEIVVVDNESTDGTPEVAREFGAKVIQLARQDFTYPRSMNLAVDAASHNSVFLTVGHAELSNDQVLRGGIRLLQADDAIIGGASAHPLLGRRASVWERYIAIGAGFDTKPRQMQKHRMGLLGATGAMINRSVWQALGRFDERYECGGEDGALSKEMIKAGYGIVFDPIISVHHTHGLGFSETLKQWREWYQTSKPKQLDREALAARRPDLDMSS